MPEVADTCSLASPASVCRTQHLHLRCSVDFARRVLTGTAALTVQSQEDNLRSLTLDTKDLTIEKVVINGQEVKYTLGERQGYKGSPMEISLPIALSKNQEVVIEISYETSPKSSALQWLTPEQTSGKQHPYLFSQCQAIHCRAVLPCQDTPSVKLTYTAEVSVPKELVALMSAIRDGEGPDPEDPNRKIYRFNQRVPIPCYLIALVVGALESRQIGPRTLVWSEKEQVEKSAFEFSETESMLKIAEDLGGPYVWGQYDLLVLPPSFPYGGMENPCLTFVTPTLLAGDKSLSNVIAHEISHSWTGNLVTNKTWDHFWLNEGHTVYLERHICGRLFGEKFRHFHALGGWGELQNTIKTFGESHPFTKLVVDLKDVDPDVAYSSIPYEKGFALLFYLEQLLGGPEVFLGFLKAYVEEFSYKSVTTDDWKGFLYSHFKDKVDLLNQVDWNAWLYSPGLPPVKPNYDMTLTNACIALSQRWVTGECSTKCRNLFVLETVCVAWFSFEFLLRSLQAESKCAFLRTPLAIIDILAILPFYVSLLAGLAAGPTGSKMLERAGLVLRLLRALRVLYVMRLARHSLGLRSLGLTVRRCAREFGLLLLFLCVAMALFAPLVHLAERELGARRDFSSVPASYWWAVISMTTVGYGDMVPRSLPGQVVALSSILSGILLMAFPVTSIFHTFSRSYSELKEQQQRAASPEPVLREDSTHDDSMHSASATEDSSQVPERAGAAGSSPGRMGP